MAENNYFDLFELPKKLKIDHNELKKRFFVLTKKYSEVAREDKVGLLTKAYDTLKERLPRIRYLLELEGHKVRLGKEAPATLTELASAVERLVPQAKSGSKAAFEQLRALHSQIIKEFSTVSIKLATLERLWDESPAKGKVKDVLNQLKKASEDFHFVQNLENAVRQIIG
jgi:hypothetical protein